MMQTIQLTQRTIGAGQPCFIIAEAGVNHNGSLALARQLVDVAAAAGADAVKFQTFKAERLLTIQAPKAAYQLRTTDPAESQFEMLRRLELSAGDHRDLIAHCTDKGIQFLSTPFDETSADLLDELGIEIFKIASGEITNLPFLAHVAHKGKPMIVSTGMANLGEIEAALLAIEEGGGPPVVLLHCVSEYPARPADANLRAMQTLAAAFHTPVGFSDHTPGIEVPLAAAALGACVIEKHFTTSRNLPGPDQKASLEPDELKAMVSGIRTVEVALGDGRKRPTGAELETARLARKSLVAACDIPAGTILTAEMISARRPGTGLQPMLKGSLIGLKARSGISAGTLLKLDMFSSAD